MARSDCFLEWRARGRIRFRPLCLAGLSKRPRLAQRILLLLVLLGCLAPREAAGQRQEDSAAPFLDFRERASPYSGPGRDRAEPEAGTLSEIVIGYFGPHDAQDPEGGDAWKAAEIAVAEANAQGGFRGKPFRLVPAWSEDPWGTGISRLARIVYQEKVWAIVGGIDGPSAHLAEQVVAKARLALVSPASGDRTANAANVPWMFSMLPGDHIQAPMLAREIAKRGQDKSITIVSGEDHDSRIFVEAMEGELERVGVATRNRYVYGPVKADRMELCRLLASDAPGAVLVVAGARESGAVVRDLRAGGYKGAIWGSATMGRRLFVAEAGRDADGVLFPCLFDHRRAPEGLLKQLGAGPDGWVDYSAAYAYDSMWLVIEAVREAGLNRVKVAEELLKAKYSEGVTGKIVWDSLGSRERDVGLGTIRSGRVIAIANPTPTVRYP